ncbi:MAG: glucose-6-phosphate isomerase [Clostridiales Family XIII bacterium]|jgi:glucose-6-phosphate isomerase|nr:glucose-6-phosphate isomerase [Clostridiales Family XIII bacterium]
MGGTITVNYAMGEEILRRADGYAAEADRHCGTLRARDLPYTGWVEYASRLTDGELAEIKALAEVIRRKCTVFAVIGIGGSYLGAKAAADFIDGGRGSKREKDAPRLVFAGFNLSGSYHERLIEEIRDEEICICHISKSGGTAEPSIAFLALKRLLTEKYGEAEAGRRIYAVTDAENGVLRAEVREKGYKSLVIPADVGGRYSVLTPVGLLPMAVAGIDIGQVIEGAKASSAPALMRAAKRLACVRRSIQEEGKTVEVIGAFEPFAAAFTDWILQLYGESEGKDGKGMLPVGVGLSRDLHSLGQFFQEGNQVFCETLIDIANPPGDIVVGADGGFYAGKRMSSLNAAVRAGMIEAHRSVGVPIVTVGVTDASAHCFGMSVCFFEMVCAVTGLLMGVNPFDQPGVEAYKKEMMRVLRRES